MSAQHLHAIPAGETSAMSPVRAHRLQVFARRYRHKLKRPITAEAKALDSLENLVARIEGMVEEGVLDVKVTPARLLVDVCASNHEQLREAMEKLGYWEVQRHWNQVAEMYVHAAMNARRR